MFGIDSLAHQSCIEYGGKTIAILGNGLNVIYPSSNDKLYSQILDSGGLIMSEYESDFKPVLWSFPQRNRIVAGLANIGILIIEAGEKSGSLITARIGMEERRKIYCVPGPINSIVSFGTNQLIKEGLAKMVTTVEDIIKNPKDKHSQMNLFGQMSAEEKNIVSVLSREAMSADELSKSLKIEISSLLTRLSMMEMQGIIEEQSGKYYLCIV
jgi:DNA processing protein